jgi:hypothetical protein
MSLCILLAILVSAAEAAPFQKRQYCGKDFNSIFKKVRLSFKIIKFSFGFLVF